MLEFIERTGNLYNICAEPANYKFKPLVSSIHQTISAPKGNSSGQTGMEIQELFKCLIDRTEPDILPLLKDETYSAVERSSK